MSRAAAARYSFQSGGRHKAVWRIGAFLVLVYLPSKLKYCLRLRNTRCYILWPFLTETTNVSHTTIQICCTEASLFALRALRIVFLKCMNPTGICCYEHVARTTCNFGGVNTKTMRRYPSSGTLNPDRLDETQPCFWSVRGVRIPPRPANEPFSMISSVQTVTVLNDADPCA